VLPKVFGRGADGGRRLLATGAGGTWTVSADGASRRLGSWPQASWSPHGLHIAVAGRDRLAAIDSHGVTRWALARPAVSDPRWYPPTGFRIAYISGSQLRIVAGDGTGDHPLAAYVAPVPPAWRPGHPYQLACGFASSHGSNDGAAPPRHRGMKFRHLCLMMATNRSTCLTQQRNLHLRPSRDARSASRGLRRCL
jgi:hypothetical protein